MITIKKPMRNMLIAVGALFLFIVLYKMIAFVVVYFQNSGDDKAVTVSTMSVGYEEWSSNLVAIGSLAAINGISVTSQVDGQIQKIHIVSNQQVKAGDPLIQLNADPDIAALEALEMQSKLSELTYKRDKEQFKINAISEEMLEEDEYTMKMNQALAKEQAALVEQKTIRAPFDGKLGILYLRLGEYISAGDPLIALQELNPLYVYFYLPERDLPAVAVGQKVEVQTDSFPNRTFSGVIKAINPIVDEDTRNIGIEALIDNPTMELLPGMFAHINIITGKSERYITVPQSAISYNPYGNLVYTVNSSKKKLVATQRFVKLGETRGDQVAVVEGLKEGEVIVTSGQLKLKNNMKVIVNNKVVPSNDEEVDVEDDRE